MAKNIDEINISNDIKKHFEIIKSYDQIPELNKEIVEIGRIPGVELILYTVP